MFVFVSYKSEDANLVRRVAEQLTACGLDLWFNEYRILAGEYEKFQSAIDAGIAQATHAVVFTNDRWAGADWCRYEMNGLLARIPDHSRIVEVAIPWEGKPREVFPDLLVRPAVVFKGDPRRPRQAEVHDLVTGVLDRLGFRTGLTALPDPDPKARPEWLATPGVTYDPGFFRLDEAKTRQQLRARSLQSDQVLGLRTVVYSLAAAGVEVTMDVYATSFESPISRLAIDESGVSDDRAVYEAYLRYAKQWLPSEHGHFRHVVYDPKGLHLVFVDGTSQIALTYVSNMEGETRSQARWERRYAVRIPNRLTGGDGELAFVFSAGLSGDAAQQLRAWCRLAPWFDAIVESARVRTPSTSQAMAMALPAAVVKAAVAAGIGWLGWDMVVRHMSWWRLAVIAAIFGLAVGDLGSYLSSRTYRALLASLRPARDDLTSPSSASRFVSGFWFNLVTAPFVNFGLLVRGFIATAAAAFGYLIIPVLAGWAAMFSKKAFIKPPGWLTGHWPIVGLVAAGLFGVAASQLTRALVKARFLKVPKKSQDD